MNSTHIRITTNDRIAIFPDRKISSHHIHSGLSDTQVKISVANLDPLYFMVNLQIRIDFNDRIAVFPDLDRKIKTFTSDSGLSDTHRCFGLWIWISISPWETCGSGLFQKVVTRSESGFESDPKTGPASPNEGKI